MFHVHLHHGSVIMHFAPAVLLVSELHIYHQNLPNSLTPRLLVPFLQESHFSGKTWCFLLQPWVILHWTMVMGGRTRSSIWRSWDYLMSTPYSWPPPAQPGHEVSGSQPKSSNLGLTLWSCSGFEALFQQLYIASLAFSVEKTATTLTQMFSDTSYLRTCGAFCFCWKEGVSSQKVRVDMSAYVGCLKPCCRLYINIYMGEGIAVLFVIHYDNKTLVFCGDCSV